MRGERRHHAEVGAHQPCNIGALHLDNHLGAVEQFGRVHLSDRSGSERLAGELGEDILETGAEIGFDCGANHLERLSGHLVAALLELVDELNREEPLTRGDDLRQLDVGRAEDLDRRTQTLRQIGSRRLSIGVSAATLAHPPDSDRPAEVTDHGDETTQIRDSARTGQLGHLGPRPLAQSLSERHPGDLRLL